MKILVISNLYPPHHIGGYELGCQEVVRGLEARGHAVRILTSADGVRRPQDDGRVYRWLRSNRSLSRSPHRRGPRNHPFRGDRAGALVPSLHAWLFPLRLLRKEVVNRGALHRLVSAFQPDVVYAWNLASVSVSLAFVAQDEGIPVCYFVSDHWLAHWESDAWYAYWHPSSNHPLRGLAQRALAPWLRRSGLIPAGELDLRHAQFASEHLRREAAEAGRPVADATVNHWGVDTDRFRYRAAEERPSRLLYVGQVLPHKGVETAIEALDVLVRTDGHTDLTLTVAGGSDAPEYAARIRDLVRSRGLERSVRFAGFLARDRMPALYQQHDILLFPSVWDEPFSITLLEAMASGLAVVTTATGGTGELVRNEGNALVFPKEDARACADQVLRLVQQPALFERIRAAARRTVEEGFRIAQTIERAESALNEAVSGRRRPTGAAPGHP